MDPAQLVGSVSRVDLVAVSVVQAADGAIADLDAVRAVASAEGTQVLLDVTQAAGWMPLDLGWADYVVGASYKWLLAPCGAAWLVAVDMAAVRDHCVGLADTALRELGLARPGSAIIALDLSNGAVRLSGAGVVASARAGRSRLSFHLYNTVADVELMLHALGR